MIYSIPIVGAIILYDVGFIVNRHASIWWVSCFTKYVLLDW